MKILLISFCLIFLSQCSSTKKESVRENLEFYALAQRAKTQMDRATYKSWLDKMLITKQSQFKGYESFQSRESRTMEQHEVISSGSATEVGGHQDIHQFKAQKSGIQIKRWEQEKEVIEKQIFYLKSQLSALED
jgi:hypothetical protein